MGANSVLLIAVPILARELEDQKVHNPSRKLRDRADAFLKWLARFVRDPSTEVRSGVRWRFVPVEPRMDFSNNGLSHAIADDNLIASALEYMRDTGVSIYVATADIGLEIKLHYRKIPHLLMPDGAKLPAEPDPQEAEIQKLRRELAQRRSPQLSLLFQNGGTHCPLDISPPKSVTAEPSLAGIQAANPLLPKPGAAPSQTGNALTDLVHLSARVQNLFSKPEDIDNYNRELGVYYGEYESYLRLMREWEEAKALTVPVALTLSNAGTARATDIDVVLDFPKGLVLLDESGLPKRPEPPEPPVKPGLHGLRDALLAFQGLSGPYAEPVVPERMRFALDGIASIDEATRQASYSVRALKHGFDEKLDAFYIQFPDRDAVGSFSLTYELSAAELPKATTGKLHFVIPELGDKGEGRSTLPAPPCRCDGLTTAVPLVLLIRLPASF